MVGWLVSRPEKKHIYLFILLLCAFVCVVLHVFCFFVFRSFSLVPWFLRERQWRRLQLQQQQPFYKERRSRPAGRAGGREGCLLSFAIALADYERVRNGV